MKLQVLVAVSLVVLSKAEASELVLLGDYPTARCLDGSPSGTPIRVNQGAPHLWVHIGFYIRPSSSSDTAHLFLFVLEGGGICTGDCAF